MKPRPVSQGVRPAYPTRREFLAFGASVLAASGLSGCGDGGGATLVAPIFEHGEGRGAGGCIVVSPPVFLSEEEALQVVREELSKVGVTLGQDASFNDVIVTVEDPDALRGYWEDNWLGEASADVSLPVGLTAIDSKRGIGVAVVTREDCARFRTGDYYCSATSYDTRGIAEAVAEALRAQATQELCIGVFYDPLERRDITYEAGAELTELDDIWAHIKKREEAASKRSCEQLRQQVQDFVAWLEKSR